MPRPEREKLLDDLFSDYERYDDFDRDVADIMDDLVREVDLAQAWGKADAAPDPVVANLNKLVVGIERRLLHMLGETDAHEAGSDGRKSDGPGCDVSGRAQGPP